MADLNAYFKSIIDQDREAVVICDLDHTILYMNPAAVVDYGKYGGAALLGKSLLACHNPHSVEAIRKVVVLVQSPEVGRPELLELAD